MNSAQTFTNLIRKLRPRTSSGPQSLPLVRPYYQLAAPIRPLHRCSAQPHRAVFSSNPRHRSTASHSPTLLEQLVKPKPSPDPTTTANPPTTSTTLPSPAPPRDQPSYSLTFTCRPCSARSTHTISKQGYHNGTVLITCPSCKNRHVISDHLKIFSDVSVTVESLMKDKGELVKRGSITGDGDVEFWEGEDTGGKKRQGAGVGEERAKEEVMREVDDL